MTREEIVNWIEEEIPNQNLVKHMLAAEVVMAKLAERFGEDKELWAEAGLVHDIDLGRTEGDMAIHGTVGGEMLEEKGFSSEIIQAVKAHADKTERFSLMDRALWCADPLTGFIVACVLINKENTINDIDVSFCHRRFAEKAFARGANREQMAACQELLDISLEEFMGLGLLAMQEIGPELGLS